MTQSMISFITSSTPVGGVLPTEYRVFDAEIANSSAAFYKASMQTVLAYYNGDPGVTAEQAMNALKDLNLWTGFEYVNSTGAQQTRANVDASGDPVPPSTQPAVYFKPSEAGGSSTVVLTSSMDQYMAQAFENITNTLRAAGYDVNTNSGNATLFNTAINTIKPVTDSKGNVVDIYGFTSLINAATNAANKAKLYDDPTTDPILLRQKLLGTSEQQMLQVDYVARGNQILADQMSQLNNAIDGNNTVLGFLNALQDLLNQKDPQKFALQLQFLTVSSGTPNYQQFEQQTYSGTLGTVSKFGSDANIKAYLAANQGTTAPFASQAFLNDVTDPSSPAFNASRETLIAKLSAMSDYIFTQGGQAAAGLKSAIDTIKNDFVNNPTLSIQDWVQDIQSGNEGDYQNHVSQAITASQSFNDTAREKLSNVMFVFQEFYQSASSILTTLGSLADKVFSYIGR